MMNVAALVVAVSVATGTLGQAPAKTEKVEVVATVGCLREASPNSWTLDQATDPVPSHANAAAPKEVETMARRGKHQFQLIGVSVFNLPAHRGHTVLIKGTEIKATPMSRLNMTSLTMVAPSCEPAGKSQARMR
jgi:hypothetical protein